MQFGVPVKVVVQSRVLLDCARRGADVKVASREGRNPTISAFASLQIAVAIPAMFLIEHRFNNNDYCQPGEEHRETTIRRRRQCHAIDFFQSKHQCADARVYVSLRDGERVRMRLLQLPEVLHVG